MRRTCERPGCSSPGAVVYGYLDDGDSLQVWLDAWAPELIDAQLPVEARGVVCERHGQLLSAPQGWELVDRRETVPRLFRPRPVLVHSEPQNAARRGAHDDSAAHRRRRESELPPPKLFSEQRAEAEKEANVQIESSADPAESTAAPAVRHDPAESVDDVLNGLLDAAGPLLRRAFAKGNTGRSDASKELMRPTTRDVIDESA